MEKRDKQIGELALRENTMNLQQIKYIIAISEELNISKAAEKMFISQSAMSQQLMNLENELGTKLFERGERTLRITKAGSIYLNAAKAILNIERSFQNEMDYLRANSHSIQISISADVPSAERELLIEMLIADLGNASVSSVLILPKEHHSQTKRTPAHIPADIIVEIDDGKKNDTAVVASVESEYVLVCPKESFGETVPVILDAPGTPLRNLEEDALRKSGVQVNVVGICNLDLAQVISQGKTGFFIRNEHPESLLSYVQTAVKMKLKVIAKRPEKSAV